MPETKRTQLYWGLLVTLTAGICFHAGLVSSDPANRSLEISPTRVAEGRTIFTACHPCHGTQGQGILRQGPMLSSDNFLAAAGDDFLLETISNGRPGTPMIAWSAQYTSTQLESVIALLRDWEERAPAELNEDPLNGDVDNGAPLYRATCAPCHGLRGEGYVWGGSGNAIGRIGLLRVASDGYLRYIIRNGKELTSMRGFASGTSSALVDLTDQEIDDIIAYLRANIW